MNQTGFPFKHHKKYVPHKYGVKDVPCVLPTPKSQLFCVKCSNRKGSISLPVKANCDRPQNQKAKSRSGNGPQLCRVRERQRFFPALQIDPERHGSDFCETTVYTSPAKRLWTGLSTAMGLRQHCMCAIDNTGCALPSFCMHELLSKHISFLQISDV